MNVKYSIKKLEGKTISNISLNALDNGELCFTFNDDAGTILNLIPSIIDGKPRIKAELSTRTTEVGYIRPVGEEEY